MKTLVIVFAIAASCSHPSTTFGDDYLEPLTPAEQAQRDLLHGLQWRDVLSGADRTNVVKALESQTRTIPILALTVAVVHGETNALLEIEGRVGSKGSFVRPVGIRIARCLAAGQDPMLELRRLVAEGLHTVDDFKKMTRAQRKAAGPAGRIAAIARHIVVVDQVRSLRSGVLKEPCVGRLGLTVEEEMLIRYGRLPAKEAEAAVLKELEGIVVVTTKELALLEVLATYEEPCIKGAVDRLKTGKGVTKYEARMLLDLLSRAAVRLSKEEKRNLRAAIEGMELADSDLRNHRLRLLAEDDD